MSSVWYRDWTGTGKIAEKLDFVHISDTNLCLRDLVSHSAWSLNRIFTNLPEEVRNYFTTVTSHLDPNSPDVWYWDNSSSGVYTVSDGYAWLYKYHRGEEVVEDWKWIWKLPVPEKVRVFVWLCIHDALPLNNNFVKCNMAASAACSRCSSDVEDILHALRDCPHSRELWNRLGATRWRNFGNQDGKAWILTIVVVIMWLSFLPGFGIFGSGAATCALMLIRGL